MCEREDMNNEKYRLERINLKATLLNENKLPVLPEECQDWRNSWRFGGKDIRAFCAAFKKVGITVDFKYIPSFARVDKIPTKAGPTIFPGSVQFAYPSDLICSPELYAGKKPASCEEVLDALLDFLTDSYLHSLNILLSIRARFYRIHHNDQMKIVCRGSKINYLLFKIPLMVELTEKKIIISPMTIPMTRWKSLIFALVN